MKQGHGAPGIPEWQTTSVVQWGSTNGKHLPTINKKHLKGCWSLVRKTLFFFYVIRNEWNGITDNCLDLQTFRSIRYTYYGPWFSQGRNASMRRSLRRATYPPTRRRVYSYETNIYAATREERKSFPSGHNCSSDTGPFSRYKAALSGSEASSPLAGHMKRGGVRREVHTQ